MDDFGVLPYFLVVLLGELDSFSLFLPSFLLSLFLSLSLLFPSFPFL